MFALLLSIIINLSLIYIIYKKILSKIQTPQSQNLSEINSIMIEFNKLTKNNIDLIEEKIEELKNTIKIADEKIKQLNNLTKIKHKKNIKDSEENFNPDYNFNLKKNKDKYSIIKSLLKEGKTVEEIAELLGISIGEVNLYIELINRK